MRTDQAVPVRLADYQAPRWLVETVHLDVSLHPTATRVRARMLLKPNPDAGAPGPLVFDGDSLKLQSIGINGAPLPQEHYVATPDSLTIAQPPHGSFELEIETSIDPTANTQLMGLYRSSGTYCTQCEAEGFRRITYFPDRPDVMAVYTTRIEADRAEAPILLANGNLVDSGTLGSGRHFAVWHDPFPKPAYLFALVGGNLACVEDKFVTMSGRNVVLRIFVEPGKQDRCAYAMDSLKCSMRWDEEAFGLEYDLDIFMIVAVSDFNMGAMENKGLNVFNDKYVLALPDTATDADFAAIEAIIAHEYFHNWTGNRITCRDWFQLCLKEGLTVFRDQEFTSDQRSRAVKRIADVRGLRAHQFAEDAGPLAHPVRPEIYHEINNFYTSTVYEKGAEVVRMIKTLLGPADFRKGMDLYFKRHDGEAATVEQFIACFEDAGKCDLSQFMLWYSQAGTPEVIASGSYDAKSRSFRLELAQTIPPTPGQQDKLPAVMPLVFGLVGRDGRDLPLHTDKPVGRDPGVIELTQAAQTHVFTDLPERPVPSLNRGFSSPIKLVANLSATDLRHLAAYDSDPVNRWQAVQTLATRLMVANTNSLRNGGGAANDSGLVDALRAIVNDRALEPAYVAQIFTVPGEADIAREIGQNVDPDAIFKARRHLRAEVGRALNTELHEAYSVFADTGPYSPDATSAGRRAMKNAALDLLAATGAAGVISRALEQFERADNMTDRMAALSTLSQHDVPQRTAALEAFYRRYSSDPLVIDKWLALQAAIADAGTLDRVRSLTQHPAFSMGNPNRVRALIGAFAQSNTTQFNRADGMGYDFVIEKVIEIDPRNPQLAARLMTAFRSWRALEEVRRARAEAALRRLADMASSLSVDVRDIVSRALADPERS